MLHVLLNDVFSLLEQCPANRSHSIATEQVADKILLCARLQPRYYDHISKSEFLLYWCLLSSPPVHQNLLHPSPHVDDIEENTTMRSSKTGIINQPCFFTHHPHPYHSYTSVPITGVDVLEINSNKWRLIQTKHGICFKGHRISQLEIKMSKHSTIL